MSKTGLLKTVFDWGTKHSPEILTALGISGMISVTIMAVKETPKALKLIELEKERQNDELLDEADEKGWDEVRQIDKLTVPETIKVTWKCYLPSLIMAFASTACLVGSNKISLERNTVLATAYTLSETALKTYKEKVVETIGEKKEKSIRDDIDRDKVKKKKLTNNEIALVEKGGDWCIDLLTGRLFKSDSDKIKRAVTNLNQIMYRDGYVALNDLYYELGMDSNQLGALLGWNADDGAIDLHLSTQLLNGDIPCLAMSFGVYPKKY